MKSYFIAIIGIVSVMVFWTLVQHYWKRIFPEDVVDDDAMANRTKCSNCNCTTSCENKAVQ